MKFLIACGIIPPDIGGPATIISNLVHDLSSVGHEVIIATYTESPLNISGARIISVGRKGGLLARYFRFFRCIRSNIDNETILVATDCFSTGIPVRLALMGRSNRFFLRLGGEWRWEQAVEKGRFFGTLKDFWSRKQGVRDSIENILYLWILRRSKAVLLNTNWLMSVLRKYLNASYVLYRAPLCTASTRSVEYRAEKDSLKLLYVGRFARVKNVLFFANVIKSLYEEGCHCRVTFVGDGDTKSECESVLKDIPGVVFAGKMNHTQIKEQMEKHDVFVLPSLSDIYPNSILEAVSMGLPCLMTSEHGLSVKLSGVIECYPLHEEEWKKAIRDLQHREVYERLASKVGFSDDSTRKTLSETILALCISSK